MIGVPLTLILTLELDTMVLAVQKWTFGRPILGLKPSLPILVKQLDHLDVKELIVEIMSLIIGN